MKTVSKRMRTSMFAIGGILLMALLFSACLKSKNEQNNTPVAALMAFNLAPDKPALGIALSNNSLTNSPLGYTDFTGAYLNIFPGSREVGSFDFGTDSIYAKVSQTFVANNYYSVFTVGANGNYQNLVVNDQLDSLSAAGGQAFVRYVNAIPDSTLPAVTITANGTELVNQNAPYTSVSAFHGVNPGDINIKVANGTNIDANRTITVEKGKVYTVLLSGIPAHTDPAKQVQIKYITNGTVE